MTRRTESAMADLEARTDAEKRGTYEKANFIADNRRDDRLTGWRERSGTGAVLRRFFDYMKEFEDVCELVPYEVCSIDSTNMEASWWLKLAGLIQKNYTLYDAFLICHGTDTMAYTAAALSYLIQNSVKPIVLTGAQKSILQEITDARKNLHDSIRCALDDRSRDVMLVFDGKIIAGTRAKKDGDLQL